MMGNSTDRERHRHIALLPSSCPINTHARDRMCAALRALSLKVRNATPEDAPVPFETAPVSAFRRMIFFKPECKAAVLPSSADPALVADPPPIDIVLEFSDADGTERFSRWASDTWDHDVVWCLTTRSALQMSAPCQVFVEAALRACGALHHCELRMRMETALHETLSNALVHGNLGLPSLSKLDGDDQSASYQEAVQTSLADPILAARRVTLTAKVEEADNLCIRVTDEGSGVPDALWNQCLSEGEAALANADKSGRGLYLTAMFCDTLNRTRDGRTVCLDFALPTA